MKIETKNRKDYALMSEQELSECYEKLSFQQEDLLRLLSWMELILYKKRWNRTDRTSLTPMEMVISNMRDAGYSWKEVSRITGVSERCAKSDYAHAQEVKKYWDEHVDDWIDVL